MSGLNNRVAVLAELDELIQLANAHQDYCEETGANEAMKRAVALQAIRTFVANAKSEDWARMRQWALDEQEAAVAYLYRARRAEAELRVVEALLMEVSCWRGWKYAPKNLANRVNATISALPQVAIDAALASVTP